MNDFGSPGLNTDEVSCYDVELFEVCPGESYNKKKM
jgi:hypothetical protein